jgi:hypothetical protein
VRLAGAAGHLRAEAGGGLSAESTGLEPVRSIAAAAMDPVEIDAAWAYGGRMTLDEAVELGIGITLASRPVVGGGAGGPPP